MRCDGARWVSLEDAACGYCYIVAYRECSCGGCIELQHARSTLPDSKIEGNCCRVNRYSVAVGDGRIVGGGGDEAATPYTRIAPVTTARRGAEGTRGFGLLRHSV